MAWHHHLRSALDALLRRRRADRELAEEIDHHLALEAEWNRRQGLAPDEARRRAVRAFGGVARVADEVRDERGATWVDGLRQDLRFAWRSLTRQASFTVTVVATLGFGIGATTALFAVVKASLLAPLPYQDPGRVAMIWSAWRGFEKTWLSYDEYEAWQSDIRSLAGVALFTDGAVNLTDGDEPERVRAASVGADVFPILGVGMALGRGFTAEEDRPNGPAAAVLSHELWERRYAADPGIVGRPIQIGGVAVPVVGILPAGFRLPLDYAGPGPTHVYQPLATDAASEGAVPGPAFQQGGGNHGYYAVARLAPGAEVTTVNAELAEYVKRLVAGGSYSAEQQFRAFAVGIDDQVTGSVRTPLVVLLGAVAVVLLIACANVAGLLLVRGERRRRELAVRVALGAESGRLTRLLLAESGLLALLGGTLGVGVAVAAIAAVIRLAPPSLPRIGETRLDLGLLGVALAITSLAAVLTSILPAIQASHVAPATELKEGSKGATVGAGRLRWRQALVTAEISLAVVLVVGAGLLVRSVVNLLAIDPGFDSSRVLTMRVSAPATWYPDSARVAAFWEATRERVAAVPGVRAVGAVRILPLATEMGDWGVRVEGYQPPPGRGSVPADWQIVTPGAAEALGLRVRVGRLLDSRDDLVGPLAMVVNRRFVELYLAGREPLGVQVRIGGPGTPPPYTIVGVVDDVRHNGLTTAVKAQFYVTMAQFARAPGNLIRSMSLVVRVDRDPEAVIGPIRQAIRQVDPRIPIAEVRTLDAILAGSIAAPRFAMQLLGAFGLAALLLAAIGVFGVVSHVVAMREQEFGIRAALGARPGELVRLGLATGLRQTVAGIGLGVAGSLGLTRLMAQLLQGVTATDPATFAAVVGITAIVAVGASLGPAFRAARAHPAWVLRSD